MQGTYLHTNFRESSGNSNNR